MEGRKILEGTDESAVFCRLRRKGPRGTNLVPQTGFCYTFTTQQASRMTPKEKLLALRDELRQTFLERGELIDGALAALLSAQNLLIIGPPGTAKSMLADELCRRIEGANYFQWLLTRFTAPEELFGAVSLKGLEQDDYRRVTTRKLPEAHIAFLDEVFKANSSILNSILSVINERRFHNGQHVHDVPLITLFGASNELPEDDELTALYDRFLLRFVVGYIEEDYRFLRMLEAPPQEARVCLTLEDLHQMQREADAQPVPGHVHRAMAEIRRQLGKKQIVASDRRYRQSLALMKAHSYLAGDAQVSDQSLLFLEHVLWREPSERADVGAAIREIVLGYEQEVQELLFQSREIGEYVQRPWETGELRSQALIEGHTKLRNILGRVEQIIEKASDSDRPLARVEGMREEIQTLQKRLLEDL